MQLGCYRMFGLMTIASKLLTVVLFAGQPAARMVFGLLKKALIGVILVVFSVSAEFMGHVREGRVGDADRYKLRHDGGLQVHQTTK